MLPQPSISTPRLILRAPSDDDAPTIAALASEPDIVRSSFEMPSPLTLAAVESWIREQRKAWSSRDAACFTVTRASDHALVGVASLIVDRDARAADLGYWIGTGYRKLGYCTEAARALVAFGFETLGLHRISVSHLRDNEGSRIVARRIGMRPEGVLRGAVQVEGEFGDLELHAVLEGDERPDP